MKFKRKFAQLSGAQLGYIHGDVPGAIKGYVYAGRAYDYVYPNENMLTRSYEARSKSSQTNTMENQTVGINMSSMKFVANPPLKRVQYGSIQYRDYYNYELTWEAATKLFTMIGFVGTRSQYVNNTVVQNLAPNSNQNWYSLSPSQGQTAGSFVPANTAPSSDWIGCSTAIHYMDFINLSTLPCTVKVTWYRSLEEQGTTPLGVYQNSASNNEIFTSGFATNPSAVQEPTVAGFEETINYIAPTIDVPEQMVTMPYTYLGHRTNVNDKWKVLKSKSFTMAGGDIYRLTNTGNVNVFQKRDILQTSTENYPRGSVCCVLELQGLGSHIVVPVSEGQAAVNEPTLAPGRLGLVVSRILNLKSLTPSQLKYDATYIGRGTVSVRGTVANVSTVNDSISVQTGAQTG